MAKKAKTGKRKTPAKVTPKKASAGEWKPAFLASLAATANVRASCKAADISRQAAYKHRAEDEEFAVAWNDAMEDACDLLEEVARERASKESDTLIIFLLKAHRPHKYRENHRIEHTGAVAQVHLYLPQKDAPPN